PPSLGPPERCPPELCPPERSEGGRGPAKRGRGRPEGPGKPVTHLAPYLPPPQAPAAGTFPHSVGDKVHRFVPRSEARGEGAPRSGVGGGPKGRANPSPT